MNSTIKDELLAYGDTDLLYHRAAKPEELARRQRAAWDPILSWVVQTYGCRCHVTTGVLPVAQPGEVGEALRKTLATLSENILLPFAALTRSLGSIWLALAVKEGRLTPDQAISASRIDEQFQQEQWGVDEETQKAFDSLKAKILKHYNEIL